MTQLLLVRHGETDAAGKVLSGRTPGVHLNARGRMQAEQLCQRLEGTAIDAVFVSPLERSHETAAPLAARRDLSPVELPALTDIEFGAWTNCGIEALSGDPAWERYNRVRSLTRPDGGESLADVQVRMLGALETVVEAVPTGVALVVGHGDPIKSLLALALGIPLDAAPRLEVSPASISVIEWRGEFPRVCCINHTAPPAWALESAS